MLNSERSLTQSFLPPPSLPVNIDIRSNRVEVTASDSSLADELMRAVGADADAVLLRIGPEP